MRHSVALWLSSSQTGIPVLLCTFNLISYQFEYITVAVGFVSSFPLVLLQDLSAGLSTEKLWSHPL